MTLNTDRVLVSSPTRPHGTAALGQTHYSYGFAARNFSVMFRDRGVRVHSIEHPEQFKSSTYAATEGLEDGRYLHVVFRSTEDIRPIPGAYNVAHFAWEFPVLKDRSRADELILLEQTHMLRLCDEVWVGSHYTRDVLNAHGITNAHVIPSPVFPAPPAPDGGKAGAWARLAHVESAPLVSFSTNFQGTGFEVDQEEDYVRLAERYARPLGRQPALRRALEVGGDVFVSVLNPYDRRKNLANMIEGFLLGTADRPDSVLVVKLATSGVVEHPAGYLFHQIRLIFGRPHCIHEDRVILVGGYLTDEEMAALYYGADFYVCTSIGEGQNAPLLEAMAYGSVPVSVQNTAMADYINEENAVLIEEASYPGLLSDLAADVAGRHFPVNFCDRFQIASAVAAARDLSHEARAAKAAAARRQVEAEFSPDVVYARVLERLREIDESFDRDALEAGTAA